MNVVLDTNVVASAAISLKGPPAEIIRAWRADRFSWAISPPLLDELERVLSSHRLERYLTWSPEEVREFVGLVEEAATVVEPDRRINVIAEDPADNLVLEAAVDAKADYIVTGDSHLLSLAEFEGIPIVSPVHFLAALAELDP
jgi:putative PIN family toxin of toxin-antitoxin system